MKDIIKLKFIIISISTIITICAYSSISVYSSIGANSSQLAPTIENLVPNFWTCKNGTVGTSLAPLARRWHHWQVVGTFFFFLMNILFIYIIKLLVYYLFENLL